MVGRAYLAPEPGAAPFVKEGDAVKAGQTLLIIEAMKVMNPITATSGGGGAADFGGRCPASGIWRGANRH